LGHGFVFLISQFSEKAQDISSETRIRGEVNICKLPAQGVLDIAILRTMGAESQGSHQAQDQVFVLVLLQGFQDARALCVEILLDLAVFCHCYLISARLARDKQVAFDFISLQVDNGRFHNPLGIFAACIDGQRPPNAHMPRRFVDVPMQA